MEGAEVKAEAHTGTITNPYNTNDTFPVIRVAIFLLLSLALGYLSYINFTNSLYNRFAQIVQIIAFIILGIVHLNLQQRSEVLPRNLLSKNLSTAIILTALILIGLFILDLVKGRSNYFMTLACSCAFILPTIINSAWLVTRSFSVSIDQKVWYNFENVQDNRVTVYLNSVPLTIKLTRRYFDVEEEEFSTTLPGHIVLGKLFNKFLTNKENWPLEIYDEKQRPFGWMFYEQRLQGYSKHYLDPELSLRDNKVRENATIVAKRVKQNFELENRKMEVTA